MLSRIAGYLGFAPEPAAEPAVETREEETPGIEALAAALAELIAVAQEQVDGAAVVVGRSADEASAYRRTLDAEARALTDTTMPDDVAQALIQATRMMIERARDAEERLRGMGGELAALHSDLDEARTAAERDPLTGLPNRRAMEKALANAVRTARAARTALSLAFCDIDEFKRINDKHGHALGDRVLRLVGDCLSDGAGEGVFVGRQGGEEFVLLFEGVDAEDAAQRVDRIRAGLAARVLRSRVDDQPIGTVSFSAGVAALTALEDGDELLRRADTALYRAKHTGRNRVEIDRP